MNTLIRTVRAEMLKNRHSSIVKTTFIAFALAPLMGGVFMMIMRSPQALARSGGLSAKMQAMQLTADWSAYFQILTQAVGVGGVLIFGFVASWTFGREYAEGTAKDLMALPTSRRKIIQAKFVVYALWCLALAASNLLIGFLIGSALQLAPMAAPVAQTQFMYYAGTTLLTILSGIPIAFFAIWGKGYLAPLGFVALTLVFSQIIAATGFGAYFPWAIPGLFSGAGGEYRDQLTITSYSILMITSILGYFSSIVYWERSDHSK